jgi:hypothetical protein
MNAVLCAALPILRLAQPAAHMRIRFAAFRAAEDSAPPFPSPASGAGIMRAVRIPASGERWRVSLGGEKEFGTDSLN